MMNDAHEMRLGYHIFELAAGELMKLSETSANLKGMTKDFFDKVDGIISPLQLSMHPFVVGFSREPDLLGQWRAYADDGRGFTIGFDAQALRNMPVTLIGIEYERDHQIEEMKAALGAIYLENLDDGNSFDSKFRQSCMLLGNLMSGFKNATFKDEREVRSIHVLTVKIKGQSIRLTDEGGLIGQKDEVAGETVQFRTSDSAIIAFIDLPFGRGFQGCPIREVILGPKNPNKPGNVLMFLSHAGYEGVIIRKSVSSYR